MKVNGKDYPIYRGKMFETTNQIFVLALKWISIIFNGNITRI